MTCFSYATGGERNMNKVVTFLCCDLGGGAGGDLARRDVINDDVGVVLLPPFFGEDIVKPPVVAGHHMSPLNDLQHLLLGESSFGEEEHRGQPRGGKGTARHLDKLPPAKFFVGIV